MIATKELLLYWWHNNGKIIYTLEELNKFEQLIDKYGVQRVSDLIVASVCCDDGSPTTLQLCIRGNCEDDLINSLPTFSKSEDDALLYSVFKNIILETLTKEHMNKIN